MSKASTAVLLPDSAANATDQRVIIKGVSWKQYIEIALSELFNDRPLVRFGSATYRRKARERGLELDECYYVGAVDGKFPHLAIEVPQGRRDQQACRVQRPWRARGVALEERTHHPSTASRETPTWRRPGASSFLGSTRESLPSTRLSPSGRTR